MKYVIEPEDGRFHWVVKCVEKRKLVELHRFYLTLENFIHHRGEHGKHEVEAMKALEDYFKEHPDQRQEPPLQPRNIGVRVQATK